jgi:diguanylate cyclase (GGDEF)-like protein
MLLLFALATAGVVGLAGGGAAFWLCVPVALLVAARSKRRRGAVLGSALIVVAAGLPALARGGHHAPGGSAVALGLLVPAASVTVLVRVRERLEREAKRFRHSALSDPLTGIANRRSLLARIDYEITRHSRGRRGFALVMIDLDGFKALNDRFGHLAGDDLLRDVAQALQRTIRAQDTVARIGGDEFCVLAPETDPGGVERLESRVARAVERVTAGVDTLRASLGTSLFPGDGRSSQELLDAADHRLLAAKRALGGGRRVQRRAA